MASTSAPTRLRGLIKRLKKAEGYGFITRLDTNVDHFFHRSELTSDVVFEELTIDQLVDFVPVVGPKGARATQIRCVRE